MFSWFSTEKALLSQIVTPTLNQFLEVEKSSHGMEVDYQRRRIDIFHVPLRPCSFAGNLDTDESPHLLAVQGEIDTLTLTWTSGFDEATLVLQGLHLSLRMQKPNQKSYVTGINNCTVLQQLWSRLTIHIHNVELSICHDEFIAVDAHHFSPDSIIVLGAKQLTIQPCPGSIENEPATIMSTVLSIDSFRVSLRTFGDEDEINLLWCKPSCFSLSCLCSWVDNLGAWDVDITLEESEASLPLVLVADATCNKMVLELVTRQFANIPTDLANRFSNVSFPSLVLEFSNDTMIQISSLRYTTGDLLQKFWCTDKVSLSVRTGSRAVQISMESVELAWLGQRIRSLCWKNVVCAVHSTGSSCVLLLPNGKYNWDETTDAKCYVESPVTIHANSVVAMVELPSDLYSSLPPLLCSLATGLFHPSSSISVASCHLTCSESEFAAKLCNISIFPGRNKIECSLCQWSENTWLSSAICSGLSFEFCLNGRHKLQLDRIESFQCQHMNLRLPVKNVNLEFQDEETVVVKMPSVCLALQNEGHSAWHQIFQAAKAVVFHDVLNKFAKITFYVYELCFHSPVHNEVNLKIFPIHFHLLNTFDRGKILIRSNQMAHIRIQLPTNIVIEGEFKPFTSTMTLSSLGCDAFHAMFATPDGNISLSLPKLFVDQSSLVCDGLVFVKCSTWIITKQISSKLLRLARFFKSECLPPLSEGHLITIKSMNLIVVDLDMSVTSDFTCKDWEDASCKHINLFHKLQSVASLDQVRLCLSSLRMEMSRVPHLCVPGVCQLANPLTNICGFVSSDFEVNINVPELSLLLLENLSKPEVILTMPLPFPVCLSMDVLLIRSFSGDHFRATGSRIFLSSDFGLKFDFKVNHFTHDVLQIESAQVSGILENRHDFWISKFCMQLGAMAIFVNLTSLHLAKKIWMARELHARCPWRLPFATIAPMVLKVSFDGEFVLTEDSIKIPSFKGMKETTSLDLFDHLVAVSSRRVPSLFDKTLVFGENATDVLAKACGRVSGSTVVGSVFGSVSALVLTDTVRTVSALETGSCSGKEKNHSLKVFAYRLHRTLVSTAVRGGEVRRGDSVDYSYHVGDLSTGCLDRVSHYFNENKVRFVTASSSVVGMAFGGMMYGVIGTIIGNALGARLGASLLEEHPSNILDNNTLSDSNDVDKGENEEPNDFDWIIVRYGDTAEKTTDTRCNA